MIRIAFPMILLLAGVEAATAREMRILAVGEIPPFRQEVSDGVRRELPPEPGTIPPPEVKVAVGKPSGETSPAGTLRVQLGRVSGTLEVPEGAGPLELQDASGHVWLKAERPEAGDFLIVAWRKPEPAPWDEPGHIVLPESAASGSTTFVNVSPATIAMIFGEHKIALPPGKPWTNAEGLGKAMPLQVGLQLADGKLKRYLSVTHEPNAAEHTLVIFARADGKNPRVPLIMTKVRKAVAARP